MPEVEKHEVDVPTLKKGSISFMTSEGFNNPAPAKLKRVLTAVRYFLTSLIVMVTGAPIFTAHQATLISFCLGVAVLGTGAAELATGVSNDIPKT